jgi:predicted GNAT family acetyltransferase
MELSIRNNTINQHFETELEGESAYIEYRMHNDAIVLMHTWVPPVLEGRGIAAALAKWALEWVKKHKVPLIVYCPYVTAWMKRHPEYNDLLQAPLA